MFAMGGQEHCGKATISVAWCKPKFTFCIYIYIERNPVRAKMIEDPADYHWSSNQINGLGKESLEK